MTTSRLVAKFRVTAVTMLLACAINQPVKALGLENIRFTETPTAAELLQLTATLVSIPATILSLENPDFNTLAFIEHASRAVEEGLSAYNHGNAANLFWCSYDTTQAMRKLWAAIHTPLFKDPNEGKDSHNPNAATTRKSIPEENSRFKLVIGILLALIDGGLRMENVVNNLDYRGVQQLMFTVDQKAAISDRKAERYFWDSVAKIARWANYSLYAEDNMQLLGCLICLIANAVNTYRLDGRYINRSHVVPLRTNQLVA